MWLHVDPNGLFFFFSRYAKFFHGVADIGLELYQKNFFENVSTSMVARGIGSFGTLWGTADPLIEKKNVLSI